MRYTHLRTEDWAERLGYLALNRGWIDGAPQKRPLQSITQYQFSLVVERFEYRALVMSSHPGTSPSLPRWIQPAR